MSVMSVLDILQLVSAILLVTVILLQQRGTGLGSAFGGDGGNAYRTIRGLEKTLVVATVVLAFVFFGSTLAHVLL
ncbi:preprotein translocase subunit SecG [Candidatus Uhrbacteria bacterium]|nr:preprotein translocase subunit SecG [Candidatus Uhrbacteria bacterium]MBI4434377.1 preprotein translocase subunit SecG [Candidatus Uhrbacteria bacterium]